MDPIIISLLVILHTIFAYIIYQAWKINKFFEDKNIPYIKPWMFIGNAWPIVFMRTSAAERHQDICNKFPNEPFVGYFDFMKPTILVKEPEMVEKILIKDFIHFVDHGFVVDEDRNPLDSNLFTMTGKRWKAVRNKLSPMFTTGKLKMMYSSMADCGDELVKQLAIHEEVDLRDIVGRFTMDVIGSCAFGIEAKNLTNPDNEFRRMGKKAFDMTLMQFLKFILIINFPSLFKLLNISFNQKDVVQYFTKIIRDTVKYRRENNYVRNDFLQLMMQLQDKGYVEVHTKDAADDYLNIDNNTYTTEKFEMSDDQITGQAFTFLTAGFEGTNVAILFTLYELSKQPELQKKVREEIQRETKLAGSLTYDAIKEMHFLEQCVHEAMRKYPVAPMLFRMCTKEYTLPNGVTIKPGQAVMIAVRSIHYNPTYYPEPEKFKPERFGPDQTLPPCAFLPFGNGPRICIAMRFALMQIKYCIAKLLLNYNFEESPKTVEPLKLDVRAFFTAPKDKIYFKVKKLTA